MRRKEREITDINGIEEILLLCKTCRVAMVDRGEAYLVPLSFGYRIFDGGVLELYFHSAREGRKIDALQKRSRVCFEISYEGEPVFSETPCNSGYYFACVLGFGEAVFIEDEDKKREALSFIFERQTGRDVKFTAEQVKNVCVFKIVSKEFTGKRRALPK